MRILLFLVVTSSIVAVSQMAYAGSVESSLISKSELRAERIKARNQASILFGPKAVAPAVTAYDLSVGAAYTGGEDSSKTWVTPVELDITLPDKLNVFSFQTDGYTNVNNQGRTESGLSSINLAASHSFKTSDGHLALNLGAGVSVPTGGSVGGSSSAQSLSVKIIQSITEKWIGEAALSEEHSNTTPAPGASNSANTGLFMLRYKVDSNYEWGFVIDRSVRGGAGGTTEISGEYDFPLTKVLGGVFTLTRGLTVGSRDTTLEFDLTHSF